MFEGFHTSYDKHQLSEIHNEKFKRQDKHPRYLSPFSHWSHSLPFALNSGIIRCRAKSTASNFCPSGYEMYPWKFPSRRRQQMRGGRRRKILAFSGECQLLSILIILTGWNTCMARNGCVVITVYLINSEIPSMFFRRTSNKKISLHRLPRQKRETRHLNGKLSQWYASF